MKQEEIDELLNLVDNEIIPEAEGFLNATSASAKEVEVSKKTHNRFCELIGKATAELRETNREGETVFKVKVRRADVYDAVRNLLLNEFKVIPQDLLSAIDQKLENKIRDVFNKYLENYQMQRRVDNAVESEIKEIPKRIDSLVKQRTDALLQVMITKQIVELINSETFATALLKIAQSISEKKKGPV